MILKQRFVLQQELAIKCSVCGSVRGHTANCPLKLLDDLVRQRPMIDCPKCVNGKLNVNLNDYYECSICHTQFCTANIADTPNPERVLLIDEKNDNYFPALVLARKGEGKIVIEMQIANLQERILQERIQTITGIKSVKKNQIAVEYIPKLKTDFIQALFYDTDGTQRIKLDGLKHSIFSFLSMRITASNPIDKSIYMSFPSKVLAALNKDKLSELHGQMKQLSSRDEKKRNGLADQQVKLVALAIARVEKEAKAKLPTPAPKETPFELKLIGLLVEQK